MREGLLLILAGMMMFGGSIGLLVEYISKTKVDPSATFVMVRRLKGVFFWTLVPDRNMTFTLSGGGWVNVSFGHYTIEVTSSEYKKCPVKYGFNCVLYFSVLSNTVYLRSGETFYPLLGD